MNETSFAVLEGVGKCYPRGSPAGDEVWAVRGLDLRIGPGEVVGLLGPNRAGKTTVAKLLASLCQPTEGRLRRFGRPASDRSTLGRLGLVPGAPAFPLDLTATDLLNFLGTLSLRHPEALRGWVPKVLERFGLADRAREPLRRFSKGMLQRLGLAQAVLTGPDLLVLDEPSEGLDLEGRGLLHDLTREWRAAGRSIVLITHAAAEVERLCDRVVVLRDGRKVHDGPVASLVTSAEPLEDALDTLFRRPAA